MLLQREPGWNRRIQRWVMLVEHEPSIFSVKQRDTACSRLNHVDLTNSAVHSACDCQTLVAACKLPADGHLTGSHVLRLWPTRCYSWYGLPLYAYLIRRTGTFIFP